jgi:DNA-binding NarL/FixJ family response regulator
MADNGASKRVVSPAQVGRAEELDRLVSAVLAPPAVVVVEGEAGIGKTRLVTELAARPEVDGRRVLVGRCHRIRESFPLGPVVEAVRGLGEELRRMRLPAVVGALRPLLPEVAAQLPPLPEAQADHGVERHRVFRGLVEVLDALAPATLVLEDLHWADEQTADFVGYLLSEAHPGLSVVLTYRGEDVDPALRAIAAKRHPSVSRTDLTLAPLDARETGVLAAAILGVDRVSDEFAAYLCERASGSPFAVEELLALLRTRGTLVRRGAGWARRALAELDVPTSIRDSVLERVSRLADDARSVVEAAAVLQMAVSQAVLEGTTRTPPARVLAGLEEALDSGLLTEQGDAIGFRHVLAAQAVYEDMPGPRRRDLHARAATALAAVSPVPLGQVAHHLRHAGRLDEWVGAAERAADQALALGHDVEAVRLLEEVLRHAPLEPDRAGRLATKLGQAAIEALQTRDVAELLSRVLERELSPPVRGELRFQLALLLHELGDDPVRERQLFVDVAELDDRPKLRAWASMVLGVPTARGVALAEHRRWLQRALDLLPEVGDPTFETFLLGKVAMVLAPVGDPQWRGLIKRIEHHTGGTPRHRSEVNAFWSVGTQACYAGHHETAHRLLTAALAGAVAGESTRLELSIRSGLALLQYCRGSWGTLGDEVATVIDELAGHPRACADALVVAGCLALVGGDLDRAADQLTRLVAQIEALGGFDLLPLPMAAWLRLAVARGQVDAAVADADRLLATVAQKGVWGPAMRALPAATEALLAAGEVPRARAYVRRYAEAVRDLDVPLAPAALAHARGALAQAAGRPRAAARQFLAAADRYDARQCPYEAAQARELAARALYESAASAPPPAGVTTAPDQVPAAAPRGADPGASDAVAADGADPGTPDALAAGVPAAGPTLLAALATYHRLGAAWDAARAARTAREHGLPLPARHRRGRRGYGSELSPRERQVAELAAIGRSNKEIAADLFLSVHTVARHITAAMRKLDVRSRAALASRLTGADR